MPLTGMDYGERAPLELLQSTNPAPAPATVPAATPASSGPVEGAPAPDPRLSAMADAQAMAPPTGLLGATSRPDEPVTAGLPFGPGAASFTPPMVPGQVAMGDVASLIAAETGDLGLLRLAQASRLWR